MPVPISYSFLKSPPREDNPALADLLMYYLQKEKNKAGKIKFTDWIKNEIIINKKNDTWKIKKGFINF